MPHTQAALTNSLAMQASCRGFAECPIMRHIDGFLPKDSAQRGATRKCADWQEGYRIKDTLIGPDDPGVVVTRLEYSFAQPKLDWVIATWDLGAVRGLDEPEFTRLIGDAYMPYLPDLLVQTGFLQKKYAGSFRLKNHRQLPRKKRHQKAQKWVQKEVLGQTIWVKARGQKRKRD